MEWDEATCGQMVYLYNETQVNFGGRTAAFFASMARLINNSTRAKRQVKPYGSPQLILVAAPLIWPSLNTGWMRVLAIMSKSAHVYCSVKGLSRG